MTSRLVTVGLILSLSLRLRQWKLMRISEEGRLDFYAAIREVLDHWARQIEAQSLSVSLETIAENAVEIYLNSEGEASWDRLRGIGDQLIEQSQEIEVLILNRPVEIGHLSAQKEIAKALNEGELVKFADAATDITGLKNATERRDRLKEFLIWVCQYAGDSERILLGDVLEEKQELTTGVVELFKSRNYFPLFSSYHGRNARKRRKV